MPSLTSLPHVVWMLLGIVELLCVLGLVLPAFKKSLGKLAPLAAITITAEMLLFSVVHLFSGVADNSPMIYWLVVAAICVFIAWGRFVLKPIQQT